ncbi:uncharacterized protein QC763_208230 [Podospora pseudopauciseta]|uniref:F-box domain-containing protein n=1 Tax=Podospora pseudopauciseta TaxID=2093780 RepID=A0ABR0HQ40_9PEZI|nr:hypothetical protein QC763_208230 [Podospora pseudopauciseta]
MGAINPQEDSYLAQVPVELLLRITRWIRTSDLANVRLSCKCLERNLFNFFAHEFFRKRQFMVSVQSLQTLVSISKHSTLAPFLKHVIICTDRVGNSWEANKLPAEKHRIWLRAKAEQNNMFTTGLLRDMLAEAFAALPHLETVDLRDFNSETRNRDNGSWRSYGAVTLEKSIGLRLQTGVDNGQLMSDTYPTRVFTAIISALGASGAQPNTIEVNLRDKNWGLHDSAFAIPPPLEPKLAPILANLKTLHLCFCIKDHFFMIHDFLTMARNVTWLRLNFNHQSSPHDRTELGPVLFKWLEQPESDTPLTDIDRKPVSFPNLERLDIGWISVAPQPLLTLITKFSPTLKHLCLRRVSLCHSERDSQTETNPWVAFFNSLKKVRGIKLRVLELSDIYHGKPKIAHWQDLITFEADQDGAKKPLWARKNWRGTTDRVSLAEMIKSVNNSMVCPWEHRYSGSDVDMDGDSEDDEDDFSEDDGHDEMDELEE